MRRYAYEIVALSVACFGVWMSVKIFDLEPNAVAVGIVFGVLAVHAGQAVSE